ncbi:MAG: polymer-forming cytoskeletal protein [Prolixibacteraceae bacterium]
MAKHVENIVGTVNSIAASTVMKGDISTESDIRIDGMLEGNLITKGRLIIGPTGNVKGEITCKNTEIEGRAEGKITSSGLLTLKSTAIFSGEILTGQLMIEPGANFSGNCKMNTSPGDKSK